MKYVLVIVQKADLLHPEKEPDPETIRQNNWRFFLKGPSDQRMPYYSPAAAILWPSLKPLMIGEGVWQIPLSNGLPMLSVLVQWCEANQCPYRVLFLNEEPEWSGNFAKSK